MRVPQLTTNLAKNQQVDNIIKIISKFIVCCLLVVLSIKLMPMGLVHMSPYDVSSSGVCAPSLMAVSASIRTGFPFSGRSGNRILYRN